MTLSATIHDMQKLTKKNRKTFDAVCKTIREALHLDHLEREYDLNAKDDGNIATTTVLSQGWRLRVNIRPQFWEGTYEQQVRWLVHEHVHVALHVYHQATDRVESEWVCPHDRTQVQELLRTAAEISVDHLTEVLYRLIRDRF